MRGGLEYIEYDEIAIIILNTFFIYFINNSRIICYCFTLDLAMLNFDIFFKHEEGSIANKCKKRIKELEAPHNRHTKPNLTETGY